MARRSVIVFLLALLAAGGVPFAARDVGAQELLTNGGFEEGTTGWSAVGSDAGTSCAEPRSGGAALRVEPTQGLALVQQSIEGRPTGEYSFSGWALLVSGSAEVTPRLTWVTPSGGKDEVAPPMALEPGGYAELALSSVTPPENATALRVRIEVSGAGSVVCLDDLSLDGAELDTSPQPTPTATATVTASATAADAQVEATVTMTPTATATPQPSFSFINGGFEDGLTGWNKHGGELLLSEEANSGAAAGSLVSSTESTKWAYQAVAIDAGAYYAFAAHLKPGPNVAEAYLRISWYESHDASGSAISTTDSHIAIHGGSADYERITTGVVAPPSGSESARVRVMLAPSGAQRATLGIDDASFTVSDAPTPTPTLTSTPTATPSPLPEATEHVDDIGPPPTLVPGGQVPAVAEQNDTVTGSSTPAVTATIRPAASAVAPERLFNPTPATATPEAPAASREPEDDDDVPPFVWLIGAVLFVVGLGGAYLQGSRPRR